jgi:hypothetical protein
LSFSLYVVSSKTLILVATCVRRRARHRKIFFRDFVFLFSLAFVASTLSAKPLMCSFCASSSVFIANDCIRMFETRDESASSATVSSRCSAAHCAPAACLADADDDDDDDDDGDDEYDDDGDNDDDDDVTFARADV